MKNLGDITKLKGSEVPLVDIVTGGSPCQDLSVAGKREGLAGERSGLFMEQIRLIKEMRESDRADGRTDEYIRPRYMVWENVPGAFSSNKGEDFRCVLEETAKVADSNAIIPRLATGKDGKQKWSKSGCIMGDGWSIAWRVHDAQFWGVPQRRKRISLVADFGGETAPKILFEREGLSRDTEESRKERKDAATDVERSIGETSKCLNGWDVQSKHIQPEEGIAESLYAGECRGGGHVYNDNVAGTVRANAGDNQQAVVYGIGSYDSNAMKSDNPHSGIYEADTSRTLDLNGGNPACNQGGMAVVQATGVDTYNQTMDDEIAQPLRAADGGDSTPKVVCLEGNGQRESHKGDGYKESDTMYMLNTVEQHAVCIENHPNDSRVQIKEDGIVQTLLSRMGTGGNNVPMVMEEPYNATTGSFMRAENSGVAETLMARNYKDPQIVCNSVVRRLTPLECERLQGYPDGWTNIGEWVDSKGKKHKDADSPRYKALGNSIALPFWQYLANKMCAYLKEPTMASLFDGIGGFPLVFSRCGCTPVWASEIEEFPIAVTKIRFKEEVET